MPFIFSDAGLPYHSGVGLHLTDLFTGEDLGYKDDYFVPVLEKHACRLFRAKLEQKR